MSDGKKQNYHHTRHGNYQRSNSNKQRNMHGNGPQCTQNPGSNVECDPIRNEIRDVHWEIYKIKSQLANNQSRCQCSLHSGAGACQCMGPSVVGTGVVGWNPPGVGVNASTPTANAGWTVGPNGGAAGLGGLNVASGGYATGDGSWSSSAPFVASNSQAMSCRGDCSYGIHCKGGCDRDWEFQGVKKGRWVPACAGVIPRGAIKSGGKLLQPYFVSRVKIDHNNLVPGKLTPIQQTCWVAWNNTEIKMNDYEVLVDADVMWMPHSADKPFPRNVVPVGYIQGCFGFEKLFVGRALIEKLTVPGYVFEISRELLHSTSYKNQRKSHYELLVYR